MDNLLSSDAVPQNAKLIILILKSMGVSDYEPAVVVQLLEFVHRYCTEILQDSMQYAHHATKDKIDLNDLKMAIQARVNTSFTPAPSREILHTLATSKNQIPLPLVPQHAGAILPPPELRLAAPNWQLVPETPKFDQSAIDELANATARHPPAKKASHSIAINVKPADDKA